MDDVALVTAVQRGDEAALADLFEECHGWTYSTCLNALRDTDAAEEATGRAFEVAIRTRLSGATELRAAMIRLIYDACIEVEHELLRKRWHRRRGEQPPAAPDPHDLRLVAWRAAGDLTGPDRILFALAAGAGLTSETIAAAVSPDKPATIHTRLESIRDHVVADVVAARSLDDCPKLRDTLRYAAREPDHAARRRVNAHLAGSSRKVPACPKCTATKDRWPLAALAALLPLTAIPSGMNDRLLDRMEAALRAGLAAGTNRIRAVGGSTGGVAVIDGSTAAVIDAPRRAPAGRPASSGGTSRAATTTAYRPAASTPPRPAGPAPRPAPRRAETTTTGPDRTGPPPAPSAPTPETPAPTAAEAAPTASPAETGPDSRPAPPAGRGRNRTLATAALLAVTAVVVLSTASVVTLGSPTRTSDTTKRLAAGPARPADVEEPAIGVDPGPTSQAPTPTATSADPAAADAAALTPSPTATAAGSASIRPIARPVAPTTPADPFGRFGTLTVASPSDGSTVWLADGETQFATVTLSVVTPAGFDSELLGSTLTWSGSYQLKQATQYADLGAGQSITVELATAPRCTTAWTITATLTPPSGVQQWATSTVHIATC